MHGPSDPSPERDASTQTPRWVLVFGIIAVVLVVAFALAHVTGHGLGGHTP